VNYAKLLEMNSFFTLLSFLEVGKTQDLPSKFWQTLVDALTRYSLLRQNNCNYCFLEVKCFKILNLQRKYFKILYINNNDIHNTK
jgi:hypothetical protein